MVLGLIQCLEPTYQIQEHLDCMVWQAWRGHVAHTACSRWACTHNLIACKPVCAAEQRQNIVLEGDRSMETQAYNAG